MCKVGSVGYLGKDTSGLGLTGMVVHPLLELLGGAEFPELVFTVRTILTLLCRRGWFEDDVDVESGKGDLW